MTSSTYSKGGTKLLKGGTKLLKGGTKLLKGGTKLLKGGTKLLKGGTKLLTGGTKLLKGGTKLLKGGTKSLGWATGGGSSDPPDPPPPPGYGPAGPGKCSTVKLPGTSKCFMHGILRSPATQLFFMYSFSLVTLPGPRRVTYVDLAKVYVRAPWGRTEAGDPFKALAVLESILQGFEVYNCTGMYACTIDRRKKDI